MSLMHLFEDPREISTVLSVAQSSEISTEVIDAVNREFPPGLLQDPDLRMLKE